MKIKGRFKGVIGNGAEDSGKAAEGKEGGVDSRVHGGG